MEPLVLAPLSRDILWDTVAHRCEDKGQTPPKLDFIGSLWLENKGQQLLLGSKTMGKENTSTRV